VGQHWTSHVWNRSRLLTSAAVEAGLDVPELIVRFIDSGLLAAIALEPNLLRMPAELRRLLAAYPWLRRVVWASRQPAGITAIAAGPTQDRRSSAWCIRRC
jgi:hypothetical protein